LTTTFILRLTKKQLFLCKKMIEQAVSQKNKKRGFATMSPERQKQIASQGGRTAHQLGTAHQWNREEARQAGRKGGQVSSKKRSAEGHNTQEDSL
jgi:uncharacterized protein